MNPIIAAWRGILESLQPRLGRRGGQSHFAPSEERKLTGTFLFRHSNMNVRPKAIEVNRSLPPCKCAQAVRHLWIFCCELFDVTDFYVNSFNAWPFGARDEEPAAISDDARSGEGLPGIKSCTH